MNDKVDKTRELKPLLAIKKRVKEFEDLLSECSYRDLMDGVKETHQGWLSKVEIYKFVEDLKELVK